LINFGAAVPALPANTFYALYANGNGVTVYSTSAGALIPTNNGSAYDSKFVDWQSVQNTNNIDRGRREMKLAAPRPRRFPGLPTMDFDHRSRYTGHRLRSSGEFWKPAQFQTRWARRRMRTTS